MQSFEAPQVHRLFSTIRYVGIFVAYFTKSRLFWSTHIGIWYAIDHIKTDTHHINLYFLISTIFFFVVLLFFTANTRLAYPNSSAEFEVAEVLIGLLQVLQFNAHEICDSIHSNDDVNGNTINGSALSDKSSPKYGRFVYIGVAIYNSAAYFNHQCYPAVTRYFIGKTIVLCASRPLEPGAIIAENYGPIFTRQTLRERQRSLSARYWFRCECISCKENWPTLDKLDDNARLRYVYDVDLHSSD